MFNRKILSNEICKSLIKISTSSRKVLRINAIYTCYFHCLITLIPAPKRVCFHYTEFPDYSGVHNCKNKESHTFYESFKITTSKRRK